MYAIDTEDSEIQKVFKQIYNLELQSLLSKEHHPDFTENQFYHLYKTHYYWWSFISGDDSKNFKELALQSIESGVSALSNKSRRELSREEIFILVSLHGFSSRISMLDEKLWPAFRSMEETMSLIRIVLRNTNNNYDPYNLLAGIYLYNMDHLIRSYPIFYPAVIFYPKGDREKGFDYLHKAAKSDNLLISVEANYFLMKIYADLENDFTNALIHAVNLIEVAPENYIFQYYYVKSLKNLGYPETVLERRVNNILSKLNLNSELPLSSKQHLEKEMKSLLASSTASVKH
ncbi:MAG: hypothetical protein EA412_12200 [Chitinophagaceae bacterium]|nr:MAG: hypothetical protein EA412_12200 [Chitinophagaceae bacterium]